MQQCPALWSVCSPGENGVVISLIKQVSDRFNGGECAVGVRLGASRAGKGFIIRHEGDEGT